MSERSQQPVTRRKVNGSVFGNYLLSNLGYYTLLPVLPLILGRISAGQAWFVGAALFTLAFSVRAAVLFLSSVLHRTTVRAAIAGGLLVAALGFGLLATAPGEVGILLCLALAGLGISVNTLMARAYIAMSLPESGARNTAFSMVQIAVNIAAAVGPIAANLLFSTADYLLCLLLVAVLYVAGAVVVALILPPGLRPADQDERRPLGLRGVRTIVVDRAVRRVAVVAVAGWFLYGQLFSAFTLHVSELTTQPLLRSAFFTTNAVLIVLVQLPVSAHAARKLDAGTPPVRFLLLGVAIFATAFATLAAVGTSVAGTFAAIVVFSVAETTFTPFVATAFADIPGDRPVVEVFNLLQIVMAAGESLGSFSGGSLFATLHAHGLQAVYWSGLAVLALLVLLTRWRVSVRATTV